MRGIIDMDPVGCHSDQNFVQNFCAHSMTRYGLCVLCGAAITPGMFDHIDKNFRAGDCPWCTYSEPDSVFEGSPVDWFCKHYRHPCSEIREKGKDGKDCIGYWPRKVEVKR